MFEILYQRSFLKYKLLLWIFSLIVFCFFFLSIKNNAHANKTCHQSFSFQGKPKYDSNFKHFSYVSPSPNLGGKLKLYALGQFTTLNPYGIIGNLPKDFYTLYFDTLLFTPDDDINSFYPLLAEEVCINNQLNTVTFKINQKGRWHNETKITTKDVYFTFNTLKTNNSYYKESLKDLLKIEIIDDYKIKFHFTKITKETFSLIASLPIINKDSSKKKNFIEPTMEIPISSGPYLIKKITSNNSIVFEKNPNYWGTNLPTRKGYFNFLEIEYIYGNSLKLEDALLKEGKIHFKKENNLHNWINHYNDSFLIEHNLAKTKISHKRIIEFNALFFNTTNEHLKNKNLRMVLALAYNFEFINQSFFDGNYKRSESLFENSPFKGKNNDFISSFQNKEEIFSKLKALDTLLNKNGFILKNGQRINQATSSPVILKIIFKSKEALNYHLNFFNNLEYLGISIIPVYFDNITYTKIKNSNNYDIIEASYLFNNPPNNELKYYFSEDNSFNYAKVNMPKITKLIAEISKSDNLNITTQLKTLDNMLFSEYLFIPLYHTPYDYYIYQDVFAKPLYSNLGINIFTWYFKKEYLNQQNFKEE